MDLCLPDCTSSDADVIWEYSNVHNPSLLCSMFTQYKTKNLTFSRENLLQNTNASDDVTQ